MSPQAHDYEPDDEGRRSLMHTDPPCRVCGAPKHL